QIKELLKSSAVFEGRPVRRRIPTNFANHLSPALALEPTADGITSGPSGRGASSLHSVYIG
ncbi:hypothetical protein JYU34_020783, partial [Plutella xylostella]